MWHLLCPECSPSKGCLLASLTVPRAFSCSAASPGLSLSQLGDCSGTALPVQLHLFVSPAGGTLDGRRTCLFSLRGCLRPRLPARGLADRCGGELIQPSSPKALPRWSVSWSCMLPAPLPAHSPVPVVHVLPDERVGGHRPVLVHLGHVHVVDKVDELLGAWGAVVPPGFLLQWLLKNP